VTTPPNLSVEQMSSFSGVVPLKETYHLKQIKESNSLEFELIK